MPFNFFFILAHNFSIGVKSGEYGGRNNRQCPVPLLSFLIYSFYEIWHYPSLLELSSLIFQYLLKVFPWTILKKIHFPLFPCIPYFLSVHSLFFQQPGLFLNILILFSSLQHIFPFYSSRIHGSNIRQSLFHQYRLFLCLNLLLIIFLNRPVR